MTGLVLKRGKFSRSSGQWQDEDYDVFRRLGIGRRIGDRVGLLSCPSEHPRAGLVDPSSLGLPIAYDEAHKPRCTERSAGFRLMHRDNSTAPAGPHGQRGRAPPGHTSGRRGAVSIGRPGRDRTCDLTVMSGWLYR
jgi:hypothetical protein